MFKFLQRQLPRLWTNESYSEQFNATPAPHRDFEHALLHVVKATGKLAAMVEDLDHRSGATMPQEDVEKYLADLVICAIRMAVKNPAGEIDLEKAVFHRIEKKMGAKLYEE